VQLEPWLLYALAFAWRALLLRTTFVAITGSHGKTTAKECLAAILSSRAATAATRWNENDRYGVPRTILRVRPWHRYAVVEVSGAATMRRLAALVRPHVAVVLSVKRAHTTRFRSLDEHAAEKALLLGSLGRGGTALLFADDPRVAAMGAGARFRVSTFGTGRESDLRAEGVSARWPERLGFRVHRGAERCAVQTRLVGEHWLPSVLGALAAASALGVPLADACRALVRVPPAPGRLQPVRLPSGAVALRDEHGASLDALVPALRVLEQASVPRRIAVVTDFTDGELTRKPRLRTLALALVRASDLAVIIGPGADYGRRRAIEAGMRPEHVHAVDRADHAAALLRGELRAGDLVLLKGRVSEHVARVFFGLLGDVACRKLVCTKRILCDVCPELGTPLDQRALAVPL
jgi:UDP-N-acetylmuramoyl-tripeptide--D-alanyl-D-alanine ligase